MFPSEVKCAFGALVGTHRITANKVSNITTPQGVTSLARKGKLHFTDNQSTLLLDIPHDAQNCTLHLILRVTDNGTPALTSYRRIVVKVK